MQHPARWRDVAGLFLGKIPGPCALTGRNVLVIYTILFLALTHPFWLFGEVASPYRLTSDIGVLQTTVSTNVENGKFSDYWYSYIPEIRAHLTERRSGWLALWTNKNELGRPLTHLSGFSPVYLPTWLISQVTSDPQRLLTLLSLGTCFLAGLFVLLLCRELSLQPVAGLLAGGSIAASPLLMYWLTFPMFASVFCWSAGILYALTRLEKNIDLTGCAVLCFSSYSLLMTGYPQPTVVQAYILVGYLASLGYRRWRSRGRVSTLRYLAAVATAGGVAILLALPAYLDLVEAVRQSARVTPDLSFFLQFLPKLDSIPEALRIFALGTFPELIGNPISPSYPFTYDGLSVTPLILFLAFFSLPLCFRETWGWWLAVILLCAFAFIHPLYAFGVRYLGLNLSASTPMGIILLPLTMIAAYGANALVGQSAFRAIAARLAIFGTLACFGFALYFFWGTGASISRKIVLLTLLVIFLLARQVSAYRETSLVAALIIVGAYISFPLMLRHPPTNLVAASPLIGKVTTETDPDSRFAMAAPELLLLPPNLNAAFDIASVHSYDSLSSRRYQTLVRELGGQTNTYGRWNGTISPDYDSLVFWISNISLMLSTTVLDHRNLESIGDEGPLHLYRVVSRMGCCMQMALPDQTNPDRIELHDRQQILSDRPSKTLDRGDLLEFEVRGEQSSVLLLSQQYHADWRASVRTDSGWAPATTAPVNGVFQGVVLPAGARAVRLQFFPFVRFAWIADIFWALVAFVLAARAIRFAVLRGRTIREAAQMMA